MFNLVQQKYDIHFDPVEDCMYVEMIFWKIYMFNMIFNFSC